MSTLERLASLWMITAIIKSLKYRQLPAVPRPPRPDEDLPVLGTLQHLASTLVDEDARRGLHDVLAGAIGDVAAQAGRVAA